MRLIAVIPARAGSQRLPRKNIMNFSGKAMICWTIEAALNSNCFHRVVVSTEDHEIAKISKESGAEVPFLRTANFDNFSPISEATALAVSQSEKFWQESYDVVVQLMANCPLRDDQDIKASIDNFKANKFLSQISCFQFGFMNPWWAAKLDPSNNPEYLFSEARLQRSQDLPSLYCPSGAIWISLVDDLKKHNTFYTPKHKFFPLNWMSALDIDDEEDLNMAKVCYQIKNMAIPTQN